MGKHPSYTKGQMEFTVEEPEHQGLNDKFYVRRLKPSPRGIDHSECRYFVLDPLHDPAAREALLAYVKSDSVMVYRPELAADLLEWLGEVFSQIADDDD